MTFDEFIDRHIGRAVDYDGVSGVQCVDLVKAYLDEVFGIKAGAWGNAHCYYDRWTAYTDKLKKNFDRLPNTPQFVPKKGDIVVWSPALQKEGWGHIAIATGEGDTSYFYSYDQNWNGKACQKVRHSYSCVYGVLRPKDRSVIESVGEKYLEMKTTVNALRYRASPSLKGTVMGLFAKGERVSVVKGWGKCADGITWYKLRKNGRYYYCAAKYLVQVT